MNNIFKKWIGMVTGTLCLLTSTAWADAPLVEQAAQVASVEYSDQPAILDESQDSEQAPKQVGKASEDAAQASKGSSITKYVLAATAVVVGIVALILVSGNNGHSPR